MAAMTFPKAEAVRQMTPITPEERLLVETDCPYLARCRIAANATSRLLWWKRYVDWRRFEA